MNDTEMLDWLEKNALSVERGTVKQETWEPGSPRKEWVGFTIKHRKGFTTKIGLRLAIETAAGEAKP